MRSTGAAETLLSEPRARDLPGRQMLGHQGEHGKAQLLHGMRGPHPAEGPGRAGIVDQGRRVRMTTAFSQTCFHGLASMKISPLLKISEEDNDATTE